MTKRIARSLILAGGLFVTMMAHALAFVVYGPTITGIFGINPVTGTSSKVYTFGTSMTSIDSGPPGVRTTAVRKVESLMISPFL